MRAVVFDLDGTLIHSAPDLHAAANHMLRALERPEVTLEQVTNFIGNGVPKLVERCLAATGGPVDESEPDPLASFMAFYNADPVRLTRPYPGVETLLGDLAGAGIRLGVCTNKPEAPAREILRLLGLSENFGAVVGGDSLGSRKPDPATVHHCLSQLGVSAADALYVGDSETDAETAANAGISFALFAGGYRKSPVEALGAGFVFERFDELGHHLLGDVTGGALAGDIAASGTGSAG